MNWLWQDNTGAVFAVHGPEGSARAELKKLKAENRQLREDVAILKAATTFFAGKLDPRNR